MVVVVAVAVVAKPLQHLQRNILDIMLISTRLKDDSLSADSQANASE